MDDVEDCWSGRWPLHPQPRPHETLNFWVERLSAAYGVTYRIFCRRALGLSSKQIGLLWTEPPESVLAVLATGTGVPTERLQEMTVDALITRCIRGVERYVPEHEPTLIAMERDRSRKRIVHIGHIRFVTNGPSLTSMLRYMFANNIN